MLLSARRDLAEVRFAEADDLNAFLAGAPRELTEVPQQAAMEEAFFLGLRLNRGVDLREVAAEFGEASVAAVTAVVDELAEYALLEQRDRRLRLTAQGRLLSNEVFQRFLGLAAAGSSSPR
jgi:oxygen-independent coproporphyrinogen-3 oxidase